MSPQKYQPIAFAKAVALENDFLIIESTSAQGRWTAKRAAAICDRHNGIGADGLIVLTRLSQGVYSTRMRNADGSQFEWSGNGVRCSAAYLANRFKNARGFEFLTEAGTISTDVQYKSSGRITVSFTRPMPNVQRLHSPKSKTSRTMIGPWRVEAGNPQWVFFVSTFGCPWESVGADCQRRAWRTGGVNVGFVRVSSRRMIEMRAYERGVGPTQSSGSGALAAMAVCHARGLVDAHVRVRSPGGDQTLTLDGYGQSIHMRADAHCVFEGQWSG